MSRPVVIRVALVALLFAVLAGALYFTPKPAPATEKSFTLVLKDNALASGSSVMTVNQGDTVALHVQSDRGLHLELHGYEKEFDVGSDGEATLNFVADKSGRFFLHAHGANDEHIEIATIEVQPR